jgi:molecular chaperone HscA
VADRHPIDIAMAAGTVNGHDLRAMLDAARKTKEALTLQPVANYSVQLSDATRVKLPLSRERFEALTRDLLDRTLLATRRVLRDAKLQAAM